MFSTAGRPPSLKASRERRASSTFSRDIRTQYPATVETCRSRCKADGRSSSKALLLKPGGLEGFGAVGIDLGSSDPSAFDAEDRTSLFFDRNAARLARTPLSPEENYLVADIDE